jgi:hypothetical protein
LDIALGFAFARGRAFFFMEGDFLFGGATGLDITKSLRITYTPCTPSPAIAFYAIKWFLGGFHLSGLGMLCGGPHKILWR